MKFFILTIALLVAIPAQAQITLEHTYPNSGGQFDLVEVDSAIWKFVLFNGIDSIQVYNVDHSMDKVIPVSKQNRINPYLRYFSMHLFDTSSSYAYLITSQGPSAIQIYNGDSKLLFKCDSCVLLGTTNANMDDPSIQEYPLAIRNTNLGAKMSVIKYANQYLTSLYQVYSLPGKLLSGQQMLSVGGSSSPANALSIPSMAYPNPSSGRVRIAYALPTDVQSGDVVLTSVDGRELKRYHITSAFSDLLIEENDLPSGSYFYKLVTDKGESAAQRIVRE